MTLGVISDAVSYVSNPMPSKRANSSPAPRICTRSKGSARRCLFERETVSATDEWVGSKLRAITSAQSQKFEFDFENDHPMTSVDGRTSDYQYEAVPASEVPAFYRPRRYVSGNRRPKTDVMGDRREQSIESVEQCEAVAWNTRSHDVRPAVIANPRTTSKNTAKVINSPVTRSSAKASASKQSEPSASKILPTRKRSGKQPLLSDYVVVRNSKASPRCRKTESSVTTRKRRFSDNSAHPTPPRYLLRFAPDPKFVSDCKASSSKEVIQKYCSIKPPKKKVCGRLIPQKHLSHVRSAQ
ncbi:hypothetical protein AB6A40_003989 [Gnathostoma spinigerum]|uniref:Cyclin-dependent kinase inhibitor domain-containing protein n=1 Tax=Gnathostoma spinigerum TaxID=75299 RepID=A0ABD6ELY1_9BILA